MDASRAVKWFAYQLAHERDPGMMLDYQESKREVEVRFAVYESLT